MHARLFVWSSWGGLYGLKTALYDTTSNGNVPFAFYQNTETSPVFVFFLLLICLAITVKISRISVSTPIEGSAVPGVPPCLSSSAVILQPGWSPPYEPQPMASLVHGCWEWLPCLSVDSCRLGNRPSAPIFYRVRVVCYLFHSAWCNA